MTRICSNKCSPDPQPIDNFYRHRLSSEGYRSICKGCTRTIEAKRRRLARESGLVTLKPLPDVVGIRCNQCPKVLLDAHELYLHKRKEHSVSGCLEAPERSLLPSSLSRVNL